jgi:hypothetical protein
LRIAFFFRWKVKENDVLECEDCGATWRVEFPASLVQGRAARRLTELYETEVSSKHRDAAACRRYGTEARLYREERIDETVRHHDAVPAWERRLLPNAFVPLVTRAARLLLNDPVRCRERFQGRYDAVLRALTESLPCASHEWSWSLPDSVRDYRLEEDEAVIGTDSGSTGSSFVSSGQSNLLARILEAVSRFERSSDDGSLPELGSREELSVALVLFGWSDSLLEQHLSSTQPVSSPPAARDAPGTTAIAARNPRRSVWELTCPFTLSVLTLVPRDKQESSGAGRSTAVENVTIKNDVFSAHRYYSPYICGFPITVSSGVEVSQPAASALPIWKCLAARLLHAPASSEPPGRSTHGADGKAETSNGVGMEPYEAFEQALSVLRSTVSPRLKRQRLYGSHVVPT